jgi:uncharacterized protein
MTIADPDAPGLPDDRPDAHPANHPADRIMSLDVIRGIAVMGILVANLPAFALPGAAYFSPMAAGGTGPADIAIWFVNFVFVEGRMRGLFSFLFGASMLIVADRARLTGDDPGQVHAARMAALFAIGCIHLWLIWWGDILSHYALVGLIAWPFARLSPRPLIAIGIGAIVLGLAQSAGGLAVLLAASARDTPQAVATWNGYVAIFGTPPAATLSTEITAQTGGWAGGVAWRWHHATSPLIGVVTLGPQTLGAILLGMAAYRTGFLTGGWPPTRYRRWAIICLGSSLSGYAVLGLLVLHHRFAVHWVYGVSLVAAEPLRMAGAVGYAALILLLLRPDGRWTARIAATGRTAFSNYLGTSIVMTGLFGWGLGQFGEWRRATLYLLVPAAWGLMLGWSAPWLRRYRYGPLEWLWRSIARLEWQPLRRPG